MSWPQRSPADARQSPLPPNAQQQWPPHNQNPGIPPPTAYPQYANTNQPPPQQYWQQPPQKMNQQNVYNQNYNRPPPPQPTVQPQSYNSDFYQFNQQQYQQTPNSNVYAPAPQSYDPFNQQPNFNPNQTQFNPHQKPAMPQNVSDRDPNQGDPWNWGWEDSAIAEATKMSNANQTPTANILTESFSNQEGWSLSWNDPNNQSQNSSNVQPFNPELNLNVPMESVQLVRNATLDTPNDITKNLPKPPIEIPPKLGKTLIGNIKQHWSVESQPSQESSDGILSHTESSTSEDPSRSYEKSSPSIISNENFNNVQQLTLNNSTDNVYNQYKIAPDNSVNQELIDNVRQLNLNSESSEHMTPPLATPSPLNPSPLLMNNAVPKRPAPLPPTSVNVPPPLSSGSNSNPYKRIGQLSHRSGVGSGAPSQSNKPLQPINQQLVKELPVPDLYNIRQPSPFTQDNDLISSRIVHANLETTPDNSERPDMSSPVVYQTRPFQPTVENCEVAPSSDRNEYLQTGHLSDPSFSDVHRNTPNTTQSNYPPPGFRRMVLGQPEMEYRQNQSFEIDEPPHGLSRMVPGHPTSPLNMYNQPNDDYLDRQVDGQTTESDSLTNSACMIRPPVYRQVDGQPTDDETNYNQPPPIDRRPIGFDRMIPGEASNSNFNIPTFQNQSFASGSDERVVTGFEQMTSSAPREQNMDGSDYSEVDSNQIRTTTRAPEQNSENISIQSSTLDLELQRDLNMEGENLQDISAISIRDQNMDGADTQEEPASRTADIIDSESDQRVINPKAAISQQSDKDRKYNRDDTTGDESERDRLYKIASKKDKDSSRHRSSREREGRYSDRKDDRRPSDKDRRGPERERTSDDRRYRRTKDKYDTEDTDYYSDRDRRKYREGSYTSGKPPRPDDRPRRDDESRRSYDRSLRENKERRRREDPDKYDSERDSTLNRRRDKDYDERDDKRYPSERDRQYSSLRKDRGGRDDRKRVDGRYGRRPDSRGPETENDYDEGTDRDRGSRHGREDDRDRRSQRYRKDQREREFGYPMDSYSQQLYQQHQTYQYYEKLRLINPQAYLEIYNKYMTGHNVSQADLSRAASGYGEGYNSMPGYDTMAANRLADERGSVHSGRSSANGEGIKERDFNTDASLNLYLDESVIKSDRNTPVKFGTAHIKGVISSPNMLIINPSYPTDGQPAIVEIININKLLSNDPVCAELTSYPGPLIKGTTHKKTVIEFCESKIKAAIEKYNSPFAHTHDRSYQLHYNDKSNEVGSVVLMWELLILLLRQNGMVVGTDIAELLVKNKNQYAWKGTNHANKLNSRRDSASSATSRSAELPTEEILSQTLTQDVAGNQDVDNDSSNDVSIDQSHSLSARKERKHSKDNSMKMGKKNLSNSEVSQIHGSEKYVTDRFREYLLFGSGKDALEWAMTHGLWGHALFLASKMDRRTYANVMTRFANGLSPNDPLQTLYQLMSGRQPAAVTCVLDDKWGDWRPHLAMILSNTSQRPELDKKSITTLGDTLNARGDLFASQFCYLMAQVEFGKRPIKNQNSPVPRLVLLGSSPTNENFALFASNEAIMMTEIYEYACSLADDHFVLPDFQNYKYLLATRLVDYGLYDRALFYMEKIGSVVSLYPSAYEVSFVNRILDVAERLKHYDPEEHVGEIGDDSEQYDQNKTANTPTEQVWLSNLRQIVSNYNVQAAQTTPSVDQSQYQQFDQSQNWSQQYQNYDQIYSPQPPPQIDYQNQTFNQSTNQEIEKPADPLMVDQTDRKYDPNSAPVFYPPGSNTQYQAQEQMHVPKEEHVDYQAVPANDAPYGWNQDVHNQQQHLYGYNEDNGTNDVEPPKPQITMPNSNNRIFEDDQEPLINNGVQKQAQSQQQKPRDKPKKDERNKSQASSGWFGGIFNKLSLKPKNQMILPDDKNPSIVWDSEKNKWMNLEADEDEQQSQLAPPPKMPINNLPTQSPLPTPMQQMPETGAVTSPMPPGGPNNANMFKLQKGRHTLKKAYVDVFNPSGVPTRPLPPASEVLGVTQPTSAPTSYFVPQSSAGADNNNYSQTTPTFYNPADYSSG